MKTMKINFEHPETELLNEAAEYIKRGSVIAYPTETCYGLGSDAGNPDALEKLLKIKQRDKGKPVSVIAGSVEMAMKYVKDVTPAAIMLIQKFWPGPLTLVLKAGKGLASGIASAGGSVGIRVSSCKIAAGISLSAGCPITSTSANQAGGAEARNAAEVKLWLPEGLDLIVDGGECEPSGISTIVDCTGERFKILREGLVGRNAIEATIGYRI
ncbi:MAG: threonylcarbamoyl-AMP synthase [Candidatus Schekmanbacteria bacterium]|nr:threonylcarbamoyl-AMP synthase [Candidatus Schekmanbacteria bacterium]